MEAAEALQDAGVVADVHQIWNVVPRCLVGCAQGSGHCRARRLDRRSGERMGERMPPSNCRDSRGHTEGRRRPGWKSPKRAARLGPRD
jgi:hypothetical protein